jgi:hypothetical protein
MQATDIERSPGTPSLMVTTRRRFTPQGTSCSFLQAVTQPLHSMQRSASQMNFIRAMLSSVLASGAPPRVVSGARSGLDDLADRGLGFLHHRHRVVAVGGGGVDRLAAHHRRRALRIARSGPCPATSRRSGRAGTPCPAPTRSVTIAFTLIWAAGRRLHPHVCRRCGCRGRWPPRVDLDEHVLLQFGQPRIGARLVAAALVLDQTAGGHDQRDSPSDMSLFWSCTTCTASAGARSLLVVVRRVLGDQVGHGRVQRLAVQRHGSGKFHTTARALALPNGWQPCTFIATRMMPPGVGLPVLALGLLLLVVGQFVPPAQLLQQHVVELRDSRTAGRRPSSASRRSASRTDAVLLDAEVRAEVAAAVHHVLRGVVQVGRTRMLHFRRAVARPGQTEILAVELVAGFLVDAALGAQRLHVEGACCACAAFSRSGDWPV